MKILTFSGSLRKDSLNKKICHVAQNFIQSQKLAEVQYVDIQALQIPLYDGDSEVISGLPSGVQKICADIKAADALIISSPEYNGSISGALKNLVDWVSRAKPHPLTHKHVLLCAASQGGLGGVRGLWHTRVPFEVLGCHVYPEMLGFPKAHEALDNDLQIIDEKTRSNFERVMKEFIQFAK